MSALQHNKILVATNRKCDSQSPVSFSDEPDSEGVVHWVAAEIETSQAPVYLEKSTDGTCPKAVRDLFIKELQTTPNKQILYFAPGARDFEETLDASKSLVAKLGPNNVRNVTPLPAIVCAYSQAIKSDFCDALFDKDWYQKQLDAIEKGVESYQNFCGSLSKILGEIDGGELAGFTQSAGTLLHAKTHETGWSGPKLNHLFVCASPMLANQFNSGNNVGESILKQSKNVGVYGSKHDNVIRMAKRLWHKGKEMLGQHEPTNDSWNTSYSDICDTGGRFVYVKCDSVNKKGNTHKSYESNPRILNDISLSIQKLQAQHRVAIAGSKGHGFLLK